MASRNRAVVDELIVLMNRRDTRQTHFAHPDIEWHWSESTPGASTTAEKARRRFLAGDRPG